MCLVKCLNEVLIFNLKNSCVCWFWDTSLFMISELSIVEMSLFDFIVCTQRWSLQEITKMPIFQLKTCNYCKYISYNNIPSFPLPICCCLWITLLLWSLSTIFSSSSILWKVPNKYSWCGLDCGHDLIYERKETIKTLISRLKLPKI